MESKTAKQVNLQKFFCYAANSKKNSHQSTPKNLKSTAFRT